MGGGGVAAGKTVATTDSAKDEHCLQLKRREKGAKGRVGRGRCQLSNVEFEMWLSVEGCPKVAGDEQRMNDIRTNSMKKLQSLVVKGFKVEGEMWQRS